MAKPRQPVKVKVITMGTLTIQGQNLEVIHLKSQETQPERELPEEEG